MHEGQVIEEIAEEAGKSVVSIVTKRRTLQTNLLGESSEREDGSAGTGVIISNDGLILTNKHVVAEGTNDVQVIAANGDIYNNVTIIGRDPLNDLAILKVAKPKNFSAVKLANSDNVKTGQKVIAIGNALGQFQNSVTAGIISGMGRPVEASDQSGRNIEQLTNLFQTDAAINSGNSGGPLLNFDGEVIGINTAIAQDAQSIGFAIPINEAKGIIESVKSTGRLSRPFIGVRYINVTPNLADQLNLPVKQGAYISDEEGSIITGGPAAKAGIEPGDIITKINTITLDARTSLTTAIGRFKVGDRITVTILRGDRERTVTLTLEEAMRD